MIISVHLPKTAGTSFGKSLEEHFGDGLLKDYDDIPINTPVYDRNLYALKKSVDNADCNFDSIKCIHGHFLPLKYLLLSTKREVRFITWMREPIERLASHYWFWKKSYSLATSPPLHKKMIEENWSLERFCLSPELKNFYSQFLWGFPLEMFDFIGIAENYRKDYAYFTESFLGVDLPLYNVNVGDKKTDDSYITDLDLRRVIETHHDRDMELYKRAVDLQLKRSGSNRQNSIY